MTIAIYVACFASGVASAIAANRWPVFGLWWFGAWAVFCAAGSALNAVVHEWGWAAWLAVCAALNAWLWWRHWRRRKRRGALAMAGAKSRARIAALAAKHRAAQRGTRPVLRPVPESRP